MSNADLAAQRRFPSPLRYPGGKGKIANFMKLLFLKNKLVGHEYLELYAGGASVALSLLFEEFASHIHINDLNASVFAFWDAVLNNTEALCRRIHTTRVTVAQWRRQQAVQAASTPDSLDLAFSTFFLNRVNRSGIIGGGLIGGIDQSGEWKLDVRYNVTALIQRIEKIARFRSRITLTGIDAAEYLRSVLPSLPDDTFAYLDPPYYVKGAGLYQNSYEHKDHVEIAGLVRTPIRQRWVVSYDAAPEILALYPRTSRVIYGLNYSAAEKYEGDEVMFFGPGLRQPDVHSPAKLRQTDVRRAQRAS